METKADLSDLIKDFKRRVTNEFAYRSFNYSNDFFYCEEADEDGVNYCTRAYCYFSGLVDAYSDALDWNDTDTFKRSAAKYMDALIKAQVELYGNDKSSS